MDNIRLKDIPKYLGLKLGDEVFVSSGVRKLVESEKRFSDVIDLNDLINGFIDVIGKEGTLLFPTYNWGFCKGVTFDYKNTPSEVGCLSIEALKRSDFVRTKHPIYSFAVWGKNKNLLYELENKSSFGMNSPFSYMKEHNVKNVIIDVSLQHSFTFVHYVEQSSDLCFAYRYDKDFTAGYIDENGNETQRTYSMFVRNLEKDVFNTVDPIEPDFIDKGAERVYDINYSNIKIIELGKCYDIILDDIKNNNSKKLCTYKGQC